MEWLPHHSFIVTYMLLHYNNKFNSFPAVLRRGPAFMILDGEDLDPNEEMFEGALQHLAATSFNSDLAYELIQSQEVECNIYNYVNLTNAHKRMKKFEQLKPDAIYPKIAHDMAEHWVGDAVLKLDEDYCRKRAENMAPCMVTLVDPRIMNPKTVSKIN